MLDVLRWLQRIPNRREPRDESSGQRPADSTPRASGGGFVVGTERKGTSAYSRDVTRSAVKAGRASGTTGRGAACLKPKGSSGRETHG